MLPRKLPPGRHRLTRAQVAADQRGRMIIAMGEAMSDKGFAGTVADIIARAKVSRQTFYEHYDSKQACFMDAFARIELQHRLWPETVPPTSAWLAQGHSSW